MESSIKLILDTSAIIAYLAAEKQADKIQELLPKALIPFIVLSELYYIVFNRKGRQEADKVYGAVKSWDLSILYPNERIILNAGRIKAIYKLGISDSYIAAFSCEPNTRLITKDRDFVALKDEIDILLL